MKCLEVIFIRIKVKGYLKNISSNEITYFEEKGIKNKNKITYSSDNIKYVININSDKVVLKRDGSDFVNTFIFNMKQSNCNYLLKDNNYSLDMDIKTVDINVDDNEIVIKYKIIDTEALYEFKIEVSDTL